MALLGVDVEPDSAGSVVTVDFVLVVCVGVKKTVISTHMVIRWPGDLVVERRRNQLILAIFLVDLLVVDKRHVRFSPVVGFGLVSDLAAHKLCPLHMHLLRAML